MSKAECVAVLHCDALISSLCWRSWLWMKVRLPLLLLTTVLLSSSSIQSIHSESGGSKLLQWEILTKRNFSSQIRLHPHLLLMVTVPWSGESRTLMKELAHVVNNQQEKFGSLKLMVLYRSTDITLSDALGATEGISVIYYHHALSHKYQGRLRVQDILSSIYFFMLHSPAEAPIKSLHTPEELNIFLESTDKALLLLEFCGWSPRLLAMGKNNETENAFEGLLRTDLNGDSNLTLIAEEKKDQKGIENEKMKCETGNGFGRVPWPGEFSSINDSAFLTAENTSHGVGYPCSFEEFQKFKSFFSEFMTVAREFFLSPERLRFGLVPERLLLPSLGVGDSSSWLTMLYFAGCPSCSKVLREEDDLRSVLQIHNSLVTELEGSGHHIEPSLPANKPSMLLFIDRSSDSLRTRRKSKEALNAFRNFALHHHTLYQMGRHSNSKPVDTVEAHQASQTTSVHQKIELPSGSQKIVPKDKMSIMIIDEGKQFASDLQGRSLNEIFEYVLQHKKGLKLSSLAKEVGFQLLSNDFDIKISEAIPGLTEVDQSNQIPLELPIERILESSGALDKDQVLDMARASSGEHEEDSKPTYDKISQDKDAKPTCPAISTEFSLAPEHYCKNQVFDSIENEKVEQKIFSKVKRLEEEEQLVAKNCEISFFFSDGGYRLLESLTSGSKIPSVVIVDPVLQRHYVLPQETVLNYPNLSVFLDEFKNGSLLPFQQSKSVAMNPREAPTPPFVNLDFHEVDSIPQVTAHTFSEMVLGFSDSTNATNAWKKNVLVLFSNSWCGFCQRMELVVREVYRMLKGFTNVSKYGASSKTSMLSSDELKDYIMKLPMIYFMDCTLNDCSLILKSMAQREVYPSLLLFPAERKNAVTYEGVVAVLDIIKFVADHGSISHSLVSGKVGILCAGLERGSGSQNSHKDELKSAVYEKDHLKRDNYHEVLLKNRTPKIAVRYNGLRSRKPSGQHGADPQVVIGSILLATDKLLNVHPFDKSNILIVKADQGSGFQGLIINKHISWDSLRELEEGLEQVKEAPLSFGGPVMKRGMPFVALTRRVIEDHPLEVLPNVYFLDQRATVHEIERFNLGNQSVADYWFFFGYSSWGWDQLFDEIAEGAWNISNGSIELLGWPGK